MINTIFYFTDSLSFSNYQAQVRSGEISPKTIVFVEDTRSVYMGGKSYSYDDAEVRNEIDDIYGTISRLRQNIEDTISEINADVDEVSQLAQDQKNRLNTLLSSLDASIQARVESIFEDAQWLQSHWPQGATQWQSGWDAQVEAYLTRVGVWSRDDDVTKTQWSSLIQTVNTLDASVSSLTTTTNGLVAISEALDARINLAIDGKIAELNLGTTYAKTNDLKQILEWMYSGLKSSSSSSLSYNDLVTAAKNNELGISAISEVRTSIENLGNTYAAKTEMNTLVNDSLATLIQQVDANQTLTGIINQLGTNTGNISAITSRVQALEGGGYISQSQMLNALENELDGTTTTSSVKSKVNSLAKTAAATLFSGVSDAQDNITAASIVNAITTDSSASTALNAYFSQQGVQSIVNTTLDASVNGASWATWVSSMTNDTVKKAEIIASVNNSTESNVKISADKINLSGDTIISKLNDPNNQTVISGNSINTGEIIANGTSSINTLITNQLTGGTATFTGNVNATQFLAGDSNGLNITTSANSICFNYGNSPRAYFTTEGGTGMQLYLLNGQDDTWYKIDFSNLNGGSNSYLAHSITYVTFTDIFDKSTYTNVTLYYNNPRKCFLDDLGTIPATDQNTTGLYAMGSVISGMGPYPIISLQDCEIRPDTTANTSDINNATNLLQGNNSSSIYTQGIGIKYAVPIHCDANGKLEQDTSRSVFAYYDTYSRPSDVLKPKQGYYTWDGNAKVQISNLDVVSLSRATASYNDPSISYTWANNDNSIYVLQKVNSIPNEIGHWSEITSNHVSGNGTPQIELSVVDKYYSSTQDLSASSLPRV